MRRRPLTSRVTPEAEIMALEVSPEDMRAYRRALGAFATGVALIATRAEIGTGRAVSGLIVNSFTSVSLKPRLVLWCLGNDSDRFPLFSGAERWSVNVLRSHHRALSDRIARPGASDVADVDFADLAGAPVLPDAAASLACMTHERIPMGDHLIIVGEVTAFQTSETGDALTYHRGAYGRTGEG